jgi:cysteine desulfurase
MVLDLAGIAVSAGAACSSGKLRPSTVLRAMGVAPEIAGAAIRISLGWQSEASDIDRFIAAWRTLSTRKPATRELAA